MGVDNMLHRPSEHSVAWRSFERSRKHAMVYIMAYNYHLRHLVEPEDMALTRDAGSHRINMASTKVFRGRPSCFQDMINMAQMQPEQSEGEYWPLNLNRTAFVDALDETGQAVAELGYTKSLGVMSPLVTAALS